VRDAVSAVGAVVCECALAQIVALSCLSINGLHRVLATAEL